MTAIKTKAVVVQCILHQSSEVFSKSCALLKSSLALDHNVSETIVVAKKV